MSVPEDVFSGPAVTALGLAAARAVESGRPDRLIDDPFARRLYTAAGVELPMLLEWPDPEIRVGAPQALHLYGSRYIGVRTRFFDDILVEAGSRGTRQAVLLGAGLDTRAYRLALPSDFVLYEIDQIALLAWKRGVLSGRGTRPTCELVDVGIDLRGDWLAALSAAGFDRTRPTAVIAEGLLAYLSSDEQAALLARVDELAARGSRLALDRLHGDPHIGDRLTALTLRSGINMNQLIARGAGAAAAGLLAGHGWVVSEEGVQAVAARYDRDLSDPFQDAATAPNDEPPWLRTSFLTADKRR